MRVHRLEREQVLRQPLHDVFEFHAQAHNLEQLTPDWLRFEVRTPAHSLLVRRDLERIFDYRHQAVTRLLA